jgi:hypothetical protein
MGLDFLFQNIPIITAEKEAGEPKKKKKSAQRYRVQGAV